MVWPTGLRMELPMAMLLLLDAFFGFEVGLLLLWCARIPLLVI